MKWKPDPFRVMLKQVQARYPNLRAHVCINNNKRGDRWLGRTIFPDDGSTPQIHLNAKCTLGGSLDILAHELAHLVCGPDAKHGPKWRKEYRRIYHEWVEAMRKYYDRI